MLQSLTIDLLNSFSPVNVLIAPGVGVETTCTLFHVVEERVPKLVVGTHQWVVAQFLISHETNKAD